MKLFSNHLQIVVIGFLLCVFTLTVMAARMKYEYDGHLYACTDPKRHKANYYYCVNSGCEAWIMVGTDGRRVVAESSDSHTCDSGVFFFLL